MRDMATRRASTSTQSRDRADAVAHSLAAATARVEAMQQESFGLMNLVTDVRGSAVTTRTHSSEMVEQSGRNRAHAQTLSSLVSDISQALRSEGHKSEIQSLMRISTAVFSLKKNNEDK